MHERKHITLATLVVVILALGLFLTWFTWNLTSRKLSEDALEQAILVARSINPKRLQSLKGNKADLNSPDYLRIKDQLTQIRQAYRACRFLYLMGRKSDGTVFFFGGFPTTGFQGLCASWTYLRGGVKRIPVCI